MTEPQRAARLWLAVAVATLWLLSVGGMADAAIPDNTLLDVSAALGVQRRQRRATRVCLVSTFRRGGILILVALLDHEPLPLGAFLPELWPTHPSITHLSTARTITPVDPGRRDKTRGEDEAGPGA
jgi:hypothetical protein